MMQPLPEKKLFAYFIDDVWGRQEIFEIRDLQEAVNYGIEKGRPSFQTYEATCLTLNGKVVILEEKNWSEISYLSVDKILTGADIASLFEEKIEQRNASNGVNPGEEKFLSGKFASAEISFRDKYKAMPADAVFVKPCDETGSHGYAYQQLKEGSRVYNKAGQEIWPKPLVVNSPKPTVWKKEGGNYNM